MEKNCDWAYTCYYVEKKILGYIIFNIHTCSIPSSPVKDWRLCSASCGGGGGAQKFSFWINQFPNLILWYVAIAPPPSPWKIFKWTLASYMTSSSVGSYLCTYVHIYMCATHYVQIMRVKMYNTRLPSTMLTLACQLHAWTMCTAVLLMTTPCFSHCERAVEPLHTTGTTIGLFSYKKQMYKV